MNTHLLNIALDKLTEIVPTEEVAKASLKRSSIDETLIAGHPSWRFQLPDRVRAVLHPAQSPDSSDLNNRVAIRLFETRIEQAPVLPIVILDDSECFIPTVLCSPVNEKTISLWVRLSALDLLSLLQHFHEETTRQSYFGITSNLLRFNNAKCGLYSLVAISVSKKLQFPEIVSIDDSLSQYPGLAEMAERFKSDSNLSIEKLASDDFHGDANLTDILRFERYVQYGEYADATRLFEQHGFEWNFDPRAQFAAGILYTRKNNHTHASSSFHRAQLLDHPDALQQEWNANSRLTKTFRQLHADIFEQIRRGDRLRSLTKLRQVVDTQPLVGNAVLAYCLRGAGVPEEGLQACETSLALNPSQADVLSCKWSYLTELERDEDAFNTAIEHFERYPQDNSSLIHLIDSALLLGHHELAMVLTERYAITSDNIEQVFHYLFRTLEQSGSWVLLLSHYERILEFYPNPSAHSLSLVAEALIENEQFERAFSFFERAIAIDPTDGKIITGYARGLARHDKEAEAEALLSAALANQTDPEKHEDRAFIVTSLAEIRRRTGRSHESIEIFQSQLPGDVVELSRKVGPFPALEYVESLLELEQIAEAEDVMLRLKQIWPEDPYVEELSSVVSQHR